MVRVYNMFIRGKAAYAAFFFLLDYEVFRFIPLTLALSRWER